MIALSLLIALFLYIFVAWLAVHLIGKLANVLAVTAIRKRNLQALAIAIFVLIPTWDIVPGRLYFQHLCKTEGGVKVHKTVEVDKTYFLANGQPDQAKLQEIFERQIKNDRSFSRIFHITKAQLSIVDRQTGDRLGTATDFWYYGGWLNATLFPQGSSRTCPEYPNHSVYNILWQQVTRLKSDTPVGGK
ncbi:MAG: hypothetical protein AB1555_17800 [Nitrospirota bacterium]